MDDKLKETLFVAYMETNDNLLNAAQTYSFDDFRTKMGELHDTGVAKGTLYKVIKQAGMLEDYMMWLRDHSTAKKWQGGKWTKA